jgi:hypothetical protein
VQRVVPRDHEQAVGERRLELVGEPEPLHAGLGLARLALQYAQVFVGVGAGRGNGERPRQRSRRGRVIAPLRREHARGEVGLREIGRLREGARDARRGHLLPVRARVLAELEEPAPERGDRVGREGRREIRREPEAALERRGGPAHRLVIERAEPAARGEVMLDGRGRRAAAGGRRHKSLFLRHSG